MEYDAQGRENNKRVAYGTSIEARTGTVYNAANQVTESTTRYDAAGRPTYQTTWLSARGSVDTANPPIAGLNGVSASDGLTTPSIYTIAICPMELGSIVRPVYRFQSLVRADQAPLTCR